MRLGWPAAGLGDHFLDSAIRRVVLVCCQHIAWLAGIVGADRRQAIPGVVPVMDAGRPAARLGTGDHVTGIVVAGGDPAARDGNDFVDGVAVRVWRSRRRRSAEIAQAVEAPGMVKTSGDRRRSTGRDGHRCSPRRRRRFVIAAGAVAGAVVGVGVMEHDVGPAP